MVDRPGGRIRVKISPGKKADRIPLQPSPDPGGVTAVAHLAEHHRSVPAVATKRRLPVKAR